MLRSPNSVQQSLEIKKVKAYASRKAGQVGFDRLSEDLPIEEIVHELPPEEPIAKIPQRGSMRAELSQAALTVLDYTRYHHLFVYVDPTTAPIDNIHEKHLAFVVTARPLQRIAICYTS